MTKDELYEALAKAITTTNDWESLRFVLDSLVNSVFETKGQTQRILEAQIGKVWADSLKGYFSSQALDGIKSQDIHAALSEIGKKLERLPKIGFTLAFEPSDEFISELSRWFGQNLGRHCVLDIRVDRAILGGAIVEFEGRYADLSLRMKLDTYFSHRRGEAGQLL